MMQASSSKEISPLSCGRHAAIGLTHLELHGLLPRVKSCALLHLVAGVKLLEAVGVGSHEHVLVAIGCLVSYLVALHHAWCVARYAIAHAIGLTWIDLHAKLCSPPSYKNAPSHCSHCTANLDVSKKGLHNACMLRMQSALLVGH